MECRTERLKLRNFAHSDANFVISLLNQKSFIENIADKGVRTTEDAIHYLDEGPLSSYRDFGFGLKVVELLDTGEPIGMCGLLKRPELEFPDIGYALVDAFGGKGFAFEAALATIEQGHKQFKLKKIAAVTSIENPTSIKLLEKLGFEFIKKIELYGQPTRYFLKTEKGADC